MTSSQTSQPRADKWLCLTIPERHMLHHALRVFCKHPLISDEDRELSTQLANELWDLHAADTESSFVHRSP
jgi:hypothetical protein